MEKIKTLGLMSGTSFDAIDLALLETDGEGAIEIGACDSRTFSAAEREVLGSVMQAAAAMPTADLLRDNFRKADELVTSAHIKAVQSFCEKYGKPDLIGFHGQTIAHRPHEQCTLQLGDAARLAQAVGIDVVGDFRGQDVAAGGEGAPLAPLFHVAMLQQSELPPPLAVINIGGVANITYWDGKDIYAFDCGTGNALIDDWVAKHSEMTHDKDGKLAAQGTADMNLIKDWLRHDYFTRAIPKSLDRLEFVSLVSGLSASLEDGAATLAAFTAHSIHAGLRLFPKVPQQIILCGGGRHNPTLCKMIGEATGLSVAACETLGWNGDALEAQAFAWLAVRSVKNLPLSLPTTTGVPAPQTGGKLFRGN